MPYQITFEPINRISGVEPKTVTFETAGLALVAAEGLIASDEKVTIQIDIQELRRLAKIELVR